MASRGVAAPRAVVTCSATTSRTAAPKDIGEDSYCKNHPSERKVDRNCKADVANRASDWSDSETQSEDESESDNHSDVEKLSESERAVV